MSSRTRGWCCVGLLAVMLLGCSGHHLASEADRSATEALFTAVTSRKAELLTKNEQRLAERVTAGEISADTAAWLRARIAEARDGHWQTAAEKLNAALETGR